METRVLLLPPLGEGGDGGMRVKLLDRERFACGVPARFVPNAPIPTFPREGKGPGPAAPASIPIHTRTPSIAPVLHLPQFPPVAFGGSAAGVVQGRFGGQAAVFGGGFAGGF